MELPSNDFMYNAQMAQFNAMLKDISESYSYLVGQRIYTEDMPRDEYMIYDMMDMLIHLNAVLIETKSKNIYPNYMVEKLTRMKSYVDTTLAYFQARNSESVNDEK